MAVKKQKEITKEEIAGAVLVLFVLALVLIPTGIGLYEGLPYVLAYECIVTKESTMFNDSSFINGVYHSESQFEAIAKIHERKIADSTECMFGWLNG